jgi:hypothetical protein
MLKRITIVLLCIITIFSIINLTYAADVFDPEQYTATVDPGAEEAADHFFGAIIDVVQYFSVGLGIVLLVVNAIQFMNAAPDGKAEIKKKMVLYGIGAIIVFSAASIAGIIYDFATTNIKTTS